MKNDETQFALLRPGTVGRKTAIRAAVIGAALTLPVAAQAAAKPNPVNQTGKRPAHRMHPVNQTGAPSVIRSMPVNET